MRRPSVNLRPRELVRVRFGAMSGLRAILAATALVALLWAPAQASARSNGLAATHADIQAY